MNNKQAVSAALSALTAAAMSRCATTDLPALLELLELHNAAANAVSALRNDGPLTGGGRSCAESLVSTLVADETPALILAELHKHTALLGVLGKQGDIDGRIAAPLNLAQAAAPDANDPFAATFEVTRSPAGYTATIAMREGSVVYLVNATGPRSNAVKVSAAGLLPILVAPLIEIPQ